MASQIHPYLNAAWQVTSSLYKVLKGQMERDASVVRLLSTMDSMFAFVTVVDGLGDKIKRLEDTILAGLSQCTECAIFVREYTGHGFCGKLLKFSSPDSNTHQCVGRVLRQTFSNAGETIEGFITNLNSLKSSLDSDINLHTSFISSRTLGRVDWLGMARLLLLKLFSDRSISKVANERLKLLRHTEMSTHERSQCMPDTRSKLLNSIIDWATAPSPGQNILWLSGEAGCGKSAIANTIAEYCRCKFTA